MMLVLCAAVYGAIAALLFRRFTDTARMRIVINRMLAHVMEFALFVDEPRLIWRAQLALLRDNFQLLRLVALPSLLLLIPFAFLYPTLDRHFGDHASNVLTLPAGSALPAGVVAETPSVRILRTHQVSWRVRTDRKPPQYPLGLSWLLWFGAVSLLAAAIAASRSFTRHGPGGYKV